MMRDLVFLRRTWLREFASTSYHVCESEATICHGFNIHSTCSCGASILRHVQYIQLTENKFLTFLGFELP